MDRIEKRSGDLRDNQSETCLIITINDTSTCDLPLIITISDTCKNQPTRKGLILIIKSTYHSLEVDGKPCTGVVEMRQFETNGELVRCVVRSVDTHKSVLAFFLKTK